MTGLTESELPSEVESLRREWYSMRDQMREAIVERTELAETILRVQGLLTWAVGRETNGVDRMIPMSHLLAALTGDDAAQIARHEPQNAAQDGRGGLER